MPRRFDASSFLRILRVARVVALAFSLTLLCLHPVALQLHIAFSAKACQTEAQGSCACGSHGSKGHDAAHCPACELLGLLSGSQVDAASSGCLVPLPQELLALEGLPSFPDFPASRIWDPSLPRAPPFSFLTERYFA